MKTVMTLGEFYREFAPRCAMSRLREEVRKARVAPVAGSRPYEYPLKELMKVKEKAEAGARRSRYTG